jgi:hypothetical protein
MTSQVWPVVPVVIDGAGDIPIRTHQIAEGPR